MLNPISTDHSVPSPHVKKLGYSVISTSGLFGSFVVTRMNSSASIYRCCCTHPGDSSGTSTEPSGNTQFSAQSFTKSDPTISNSFGSKLHNCRLRPVWPFDNCTNPSSNPGLITPVLNLAIFLAFQIKYPRNEYQKLRAEVVPDSNRII